MRRTLRAALLFGAIFAAAFGIYHSNGNAPLGSFDSAGTSLTAFDLFSRGRLDFDVLRDGALAREGAAYGFIEAPSGHYVSIFPIGTALVTLPVYAIFASVRSLRHEPIDIAAPAFDDVRQRDEKATATIVAALAVVLFFACARTIVPLAGAAIATFAFGVGSELWTIGSQSLWQHGTVCLMLLAMIGTLLRAERSHDDARRTGWLLAAGLAAGLLVTVRPTSLWFALAATAFVAWPHARRLVPFAGGAIAGAAPGIAWNLWAFHTPAGGYAAPLGIFDPNPVAMLGALAGSLISPNRGLLVYTPVVLFALAGAVVARRSRTRDARLVLLLGSACVVLAVQYAWFPNWWGGWCYGPRYLTDTMPVVMLLLAYAIPRAPISYARRSLRTALISAAFAVALVASVGVQVVGANSGVAGPRWNPEPLTIDHHNERVWDRTDLQIVRNLRAMIAQFTPNPTAAPGYAAGFASRVTHAGSLDGAPGAIVVLHAVARNIGASIWYGYRDALPSGDARIHVRLADARGVTVGEDDLDIVGRATPGSDVEGVGEVTLPAAAGRYIATLDVRQRGARFATSGSRPLRVGFQVRAVARFGSPAAERVALRFLPLQR